MIGIPPGAVKEETKRVTTTGQWEDVGRINAQTIGLAGFRIWQLLALAMTALMWSYAWFKYGDTEAVVISNPMTQFLSIALAIGVVLFASIVCYDLHRAELEIDAGLFLALCLLVFIVAFGVISVLVPVAVWILINCIAFGFAPFKQMVTCGWIPLLLTIISAAIVPDFQVGRFAFRHELISQPEASSEKTVIDVTQVRLKQMELDAKHDEMIDAERQEYEAKILMLTQKLDQVMRSKPEIQLIPYNHGSARSINGAEWTKDEWESLCFFVADFERRGTGRDQWTTRKAEQDWGSRISEPHWYKIKEMLRGAGMIDQFNKPLMSREDMAAHLGIDLPPRNPPTPPQNPVGGSE